MKFRLFCVFFFLSVLQVSLAQGRQELRDSLKSASERLSYHPDSIDLRLQKAAWNLQLEEWEQAKYEYDLILSHVPDNIAALFYRAYVNERLHRYNFAKLDYENMLSIVPAHFEARLGLALLNEKSKRHTEAMDQMNLLVQQHPDSAVAYAARAGIERDHQLFDVAVYDLSHAIELDPDNVDYLISRADLFIRLSRNREARNDLNRLLSLGVPSYALSDFFERIDKKKK